MSVSRLERWFRRRFPDYRPRWEIYDERLCALLTPNTVWLDLGCGNNALVKMFQARAGLAVGADLLAPGATAGGRFVPADLRHLPFRPGSTDLVTLRMVVEHLEDPRRDLAEIARVLKPGGKLMVLTTNAWSPLVFLPRVLPFRAKQRLLARLFGVADAEIFPTFHRFNTPQRMRRGSNALKLVQLELLEQTAFSPALPAIFCSGWYALTRLPVLKNLHSNILAVFQKQIASAEPIHER